MFLSQVSRGKNKNKKAQRARNNFIDATVNRHKMLMEKGMRRERRLRKTGSAQKNWNFFLYAWLLNVINCFEQKFYQHCKRKGRKRRILNAICGHHNCFSPH